ncbi:uncharacterized protein V6R79_002047 [Siganus canaliculatus]
MTEEVTESYFRAVDLHTQTNNSEHHTGEISEDELIVRRGQSFRVSLRLKHKFNPDLDPLHFSAATGEHPSEQRGTASSFSFPDRVKPSPSAKAVWKVEQQQKSFSMMADTVTLLMTPPADAPIGRYAVSVKHREEEGVLFTLVVLFNPWCPEDWVFLPSEEERQEYVMNDQGIVYKGSGNYIVPSTWDYGQFEDDMVNICLQILDVNPKHSKDPADDVSARCNPIYVGRVVSAMINSADDRGVIKGRWGNSFFGGVAPSHWTGSHAILRRWFITGSHPVKYGQCWVFACVMCSVMRLLGIPCRVISNYQSAHDVDRNLTIDVYHADYGVRERPSRDSIWNFHVWVEGWMKRPDLAEDGKYDGWQVLDPTPQETSGGVYCCGPASVKAVLDGETNLKYDVPFVYAEVNADCVDWLVKRDGSKKNIWTDPKRVGHTISTKSVGSNKRMDITSSYKHPEGTDKERSVFKYACIRDYSRVDEVEEEEEEEETTENGGTSENGGTAENGGTSENGGTEENGGTAENGGTENGGTENAGTENGGTENGGTENGGTENGGTENGGTENSGTEGNGGTAGNEDTDENSPSPSLSLEIKEVSRPVNGADVSLRLVVHSKSSVSRSLLVYVHVQARSYNGTPTGDIQSGVQEATLQPGTDLSIPILVPYSDYSKPMLGSESMKISAIVTDKQNLDEVFMAESDVVLLDPPVSVTVSGVVRAHHPADGEVVFTNTINQTLKNCTLTLSGSGLWKEPMEVKLPDLNPSSRIRVKFTFVPYKAGRRTLVADFDCSSFRDVKGSCTIDVQPSFLR